MPEPHWTPAEDRRRPLPRLEDLPTAPDGYDPQAVREAFDSFYRHAAELDATLRTLEAVEAFGRQAAELRSDIRALRAASWGPVPAPRPETYAATRRRSTGSGPGVAVADAFPRVVVETVFIVMVAVGAALAGLSTVAVVLLVVVAWLIVGAAEVTASVAGPRLRRRRAARLAPPDAAPAPTVVAPQIEAETREHAVSMEPEPVAEPVAVQEPLPEPEPAPPVAVHEPLDEPIAVEEALADSERPGDEPARDAAVSAEEPEPVAEPVAVHEPLDEPIAVEEALADQEVGDVPAADDDVPAPGAVSVAEEEPVVAPQALAEEPAGEPAELLPVAEPAVEPLPGAAEPPAAETEPEAIEPDAADEALAAERDELPAAVEEPRAVEPVVDPDEPAPVAEASATDDEDTAAPLDVGELVSPAASAADPWEAGPELPDVRPDEEGDRGSRLRFWRRRRQPEEELLYPQAGPRHVNIVSVRPAADAGEQAAADEEHPPPSAEGWKPPPVERPAGANLRRGRR